VPNLQPIVAVGEIVAGGGQQPDAAFRQQYDAELLHDQFADEVEGVLHDQSLARFKHQHWRTHAITMTIMPEPSVPRRRWVCRRPSLPSAVHVANFAVYAQRISCGPFTCISNARHSGRSSCSHPSAGSAIHRQITLGVLAAPIISQSPRDEAWSGQ
jgi:hypothetical protein